ncbi:putative lactose permease protein [Eutypa lata UCREL1]|uniref:Putative lactose permease protein n=1 Tax=Eutypa lata (strain UCR-EL1) TaxID=1287681 RepID=M7SQ72_EUTLA|nr:putative lactose permease protein [Eutypa lata UCREL1]
MADANLKPSVSVTDVKVPSSGDGVQQVNTASVALAAAVAEQKPKLLSPNMIKLYAIMGIGYLVSTLNGFDSSLMGSINAMKPYQETFGLNGAGSTTGIIFIIYNCGQIASFPSGPAYTVELAHPAYRGTMAGMYNNFWWLGNILAGWTTYGTNEHLHDSWAWRTPTIVQAGMPAVVMLLIMFFPESEIVEEYQLCRNDNPWWDFRELGNTKAARYRLAMVICMAFFGQWSGNNVVSYFMPEMIKTAGITDTSTQLLINAINPIFSMMGAVYGATLLDRLGRRTMMLAGLAGALVFYVMLTAFTAQTANHPSLSYGTIVSIYLFGICFAWGFTPLQTLYAVECLENRTRAKGSGLNYLFLNVAMVVNTYGISVGMEAIGWKLYLVYIVWIMVEIVVIYFFFVETAGKTLEELGEIFEAKNPRKASTKKVKVDLDASGRVVGVDGEMKA